MDNNEVKYTHKYIILRVYTFCMQISVSHGTHILGCSGGSDTTQTVTQIHDMDSSSTSLLGLPNVQLEDEMQARCIHKYWCFAMKFVSLWMHAYTCTVYVEFVISTF